MLTTTDVAPTMTRLLKAQQYAQGEEKDKRSEPSLLPLQEMRRAIFGSVVNLLADTLPEEEEKPRANDRARRSASELFQKVVQWCREGNW